MNGGEVVFKFKGDSKELDAQTNSLSSKFASVGKGIGTALAKGTVVAGAALTGLVSKAVISAGELEQQIGGTEAVFGKFAETIQEKSKKAFETAGLSANEYMAYANKIGSLMKGSGIETEQAMKLSTDAMTRAADVASIMGIDVSAAMEAITGAAKGNFTMMDNLGVAMNATNLQAYALSKGIKTSYNQMTQAQKVQLAYQMFMEKTADYAGNYAKENKTLAGSFNTLKKSVSNFLSGAGNVEDVIKSLNDFTEPLIQTITDMAPAVVEGIVQIINEVVVQLPGLIDKLLPTILQGAINLMQGIVNSLPLLIQTLSQMLPGLITGLIQGMSTVITSLAQQLPTMTPMIVNALIDGILVILDNIDILVDAGGQLLGGLLQGIMNALPGLVARMPEIVIKLCGAMISYYGHIVQVGIDIIKKIWEGIKNAWNWLKQNVSSFFGKIPGYIWDAIKGVYDTGKNLVEGFWNGIKDTGSWVKNKVSGFFSGIGDGIKKVFGIHSPSRYMMEVGGYIDEGFIEGVESMKKDVEKSFNGVFDMTPNLDAQASNHLSNNYTISINNNVEMDPLGQVVNNIKTFSGGAKNDYNYGSGV